MDNLAHDLEPESDFERSHTAQQKLVCIQSQTQDRDRDSLSENFNDEIEAWARHAIASNGFGDY
jgi:hypothetical protein